MTHWRRLPQLTSTSSWPSWPAHRQQKHAAVDQSNLDDHRGSFQESTTVTGGYRWSRQETHGRWGEGRSLSTSRCFSRYTSDQAELGRHLVVEHETAGRSPPAVDQNHLDNYWVGSLLIYLLSPEDSWYLRGRLHQIEKPWALPVPLQVPPPLLRKPWCGRPEKETQTSNFIWNNKKYRKSDHCRPLLFQVHLHLLNKLHLFSCCPSGFKAPSLDNLSACSLPW